MNDFTTTHYTTSDKEKSMKAPTKRATRRLAASLAIITALAAAQSAQADYWDWVGKGSGETSYFDEHSNEKGTNGSWYHSVKTSTDKFASDNHNFNNGGTSSRPAYNPGWDNIVTFRELTSMTGAINLEAAGTITFVAKDHNSAYGIDSTNLLKLNPGANLAITSGTYSFSQIRVANESTAGKSSTLTVNGASASLAASGELSIGHSGSGGSEGHLVVGSGATVRADGNFALNKGDVTINGGNVTVGDILQVAYRGSGVFTLNDGTVDVATKVHFGGYYASDPTKLYLNGGTLSAPTITWNNGNTTAEVVFNGGTIKANADGALISSSDKIAVSVDAGGGVIDNGGYNVSIPVDLTPGSNPGTLTFKGGGTTTLAGDTLQSLYPVLEEGYMLVTNDDTKINKSLTINGGTFESAVNTWTRLEGGTLNLNGGTFKTRHVHKSSGSPVINFNGGTLQATRDYADNGGLIQDGVTVNVNGGTIDCGEYAIVVGAALGGTGGLTFTGGNTITLNGSVNYSGATAVTPGTTLAIANSTAKANILNNGLVLAGLPVADQTVVTSTSAFEDADLAKVSCSLAPTTKFKFTDETKTSIAVDTPGATINYWTGAADNDLSNDANWSSGSKPTGEAYIICATPETLTKGASFVATSITFLAGSAAVTVNGEFSGITQIANYSASMVEFKDAVAFAGNVDVVQNSGAVKFTGGATGVKLARATDIHGTYTFSQTGDLTEFANTTVKSDSVYKLLNGTFYKHNADFHVEAGGKVVVKNAKIQRNSGGAKLLGTFNGEFKVTNEFLVSGNGAGSYVTHNMNNSGNGTFIVNKLRMTSRGAIVPAATTIIGAGGVMRNGSGYVRVLDNGSHEFGSYADWTMYYETIGSNTGTGYFAFYKHSSSTWSHLTFDTTDYYDSTTGRTITCEAPIGADGSASAEKFRVTVKGKGKFVFANTSDTTIFSGGLIVQDTATVEVKANAKPGKGAITLGAGTKLALTATSSTFTALTNSLNLPTGENEIATIRIDGVRLRSGVDHEIATVGTGSTENVVLDPASTALGSRKAELRVEDGKLLLNIKSAGTIFIVR